MSSAPYVPNPDLLAYARQGRASYRGMIPRAGTPEPVAEVRELSIPAGQPERRIPARLYVPAAAERSNAGPMVLFFHGGGFLCGDLDTHEAMLCALANRSGAPVLSLDYRLAPESPFPAGLEDCHAALCWLAEHAADLGADPARLFLCGDSAGGNLAAAVCLLARQRGGPQAAGQVLFYANLDGSCDTPSWAELGNRYFPTRAAMELTLRCYLPGPVEDRLQPLAAPLRAELSGLPAALVITAQLDPLRDEGQAYVRRLMQAGVFARHVECPGMEHGFVQFYQELHNLEQGQRALSEAARFIQGEN
ncbi:alpha/beta hydrolase [Pseudomonas massiliensis]|uniref:alpha/beta hydrolase n=1 Tax=Pseudomonas massiliensis TaxID=522492 RepID=UPI000694899C|nr:alpha/beta hydrolase [Pseudomonas massiliensis]